MRAVGIEPTSTKEQTVVHLQILVLGSVRLSLPLPKAPPGAVVGLLDVADTRLSAKSDAQMPSNGSCGWLTCPKPYSGVD